MAPSRSRQAADDDPGRSRVKEAIDKAPEEAEDVKATALGRGSAEQREEV